VTTANPSLNRLWAAEEDWPFPPSGYVFLAQAVERLAPLVVAGWTKGSLGVVAEPILPVIQQVKWREVSGVLSRQRHPLFIAAVVEDHPEREQAYAAAHEISRLLAPRVAEMETAGRKVALWLARAAADGDLVCSYRPKGGGYVRDLPKQWWEGDHWLERFQTCSINPRRPFSSLKATVPSDLCWVFVSVASVEALAERLRDENPPPAWAKGGEAYKVWLGRPQVIAEAQRRTPGRTKQGLADALSAMDRETGGKGNVETITKSLRDHHLWPAGYD